MTRQHAIEAIEGPCKVHGIEVAEGFPKALLDKLNPEGKEVELTYLQVFLDKIYRFAQNKGKSKKSPPLQGGDLEGGEVDQGDTEGGTTEIPDLRMTLSMLDKIGDVSDLLGSFLEEQIGELEDPDTGC
ncbi:MAG: hypothetical protein AMS27_08030 [Bacteroides sp. SM23_62_1]|nr:MAG: hypothetical protein AMS27_08030 [Bacteroides sp. SM23_62_1]